MPSDIKKEEKIENFVISIVESKNLKAKEILESILAEKLSQKIKETLEKNNNK